MKAIKKKILLASLSISVITPFYEGVVYAEDIKPNNPSNNIVEVDDETHTINGTTQNSNVSNYVNFFYTDNIFGGYSATGTTQNILNIKGGKFAGSAVGLANGGINPNNQYNLGSAIYGGWSDSEKVHNNTVNIGGDNPSYPEIGMSVYGGFSNNGITEHNIVNVTGGMFTAPIYGGYSTSDAKLNEVNISGGATSHPIYGGISEKGITEKNKVKITGGSLGSSVNGGYSTEGNVTGNEVTISGGTITHLVYGGHSMYGNVTGNIVNIEGGNFENYPLNTVWVYGGDAGSGSAIGNTINISGNPDLKQVLLYGGSSNNPNNSSGNTLNIYTKDLTAKNIAYLQNINFYIPVGTVNGDTMLTLTDTNGTYLSDVAINAGIQAGNTTLKNGDVVNLLTNANGITTDATTTYGKLTEGVSLTYDLAVSQQGNSIVAQIGNPINNPINNNPVSNNLVNNQNLIPLIQNQDFTKYTNPETKILTVSQPISFVLPEIPNIPDNIVDTFPEFDLNSDYTDNNINDSNNNSNDNNDKDEIEISDSKDKSEEEKNKNVGSTDSPTHKGWEIFGDMGGGSLKHKTGGGGYIDTKMQNIDLGFARSLGNGLNKMTIAPIIDYQKTDFDSYIPDGVNDDGSTRYVHGTGTTKYTGGGFILRNMNHNGFYYEGSLRIGKSKTDFASDNLDTTGFFGRVTYDTSATIVNGHIKIGKHLRVSQNSLIDIYGFYYHTHQGGSSATLSSGEHYDFSSANSGRLRIGYRWTTRTSPISKVYTGLAFQYEHNTGVIGSYKDYKTPDTGSSGSSGMLEFGWLIKPLKNNPWAVDINATGWVGYQRGITAMAKISKAF